MFVAHGRDVYFFFSGRSTNVLFYREEKINIADCVRRCRRTNICKRSSKGVWVFHILSTISLTDILHKGKDVESVQKDQVTKVR